MCAALLPRPCRCSCSAVCVSHFSVVSIVLGVSRCTAQFPHVTGVQGVNARVFICASFSIVSHSGAFSAIFSYSHISRQKKSCVTQSSQSKRCAAFVRRSWRSELPFHCGLVNYCTGLEGWISWALRSIFSKAYDTILLLYRSFTFSSQQSTCAGMVCGVNE